MTRGRPDQQPEGRLQMKKYYYADTTRVATRTGSARLKYLLEDHISSTAITANSSGVKTAEIHYYPWGTIGKKKGRVDLLNGRRKVTI